MTADSDQPVLILGAGINGAAVAREFILNDVPVCLVDVHDIACGATARSSRLIHGGLRYLEHGDFALVRESLEERSRLQRLAPQFVSPLRLHIPVSRRSGGWLQFARRFLGVDHWLRKRRSQTASKPSGPRGLWLIRTGLWIYDRFASDASFERACVASSADRSVPQVDADTYPWQCVYADGQMLYPERFVVALLEDARQLAAERQTEFRLLTYHRAEPQGDAIALRSVRDRHAPQHTICPRLIVNATGAWGDWTLDELNKPPRQLFGGTKGSHFISYQPALKAALGEGGVYAEAADGRLVFVLPFGHGVLVGTTDERFRDRPERAVATSEEIAYLVELVNELFPQIDLTQDDIELHYAGVRPLPYQPDGRTSAIPRGHAIEWSNEDDIPVMTLVGGKLTTCRALAEEVVAASAQHLQLANVVNSQNRIVPGGEHYPADANELLERQSRLADSHRIDLTTIQSIWSLCGTRADEAAREIGDSRLERIVGTDLPLSYVTQVIEQEWVTTLNDLVERRLMLLFQPDLKVETLHALAACLVQSGKLKATEATETVERTVIRLREVYGKTLTSGLPNELGGDTAVASLASSLGTE